MRADRRTVPLLLEHLVIVAADKAHGPVHQGGFMELVPVETSRTTMHGVVSELLDRHMLERCEGPPEPLKRNARWNRRIWVRPTRAGRIYANSVRRKLTNLRDWALEVPS